MHSGDYTSSDQGSLKYSFWRLFRLHRRRQKSCGKIKRILRIPVLWRHCKCPEATNIRCGRRNTRASGLRSSRCGLHRITTAAWCSAATITQWRAYWGDWGHSTLALINLTRNFVFLVPATPPVDWALKWLNMFLEARPPTRRVHWLWSLACVVWKLTMLR